MNWLDALFLGILQGITEFLPISSSGHLVLAEHYLGLNTQDLGSFDILLHMGTLLALLIYFKEEVWGMLKAFGRLISGKFDKGDKSIRLIFLLIIGTIPAVIFGLLWNEQLDKIFRTLDMTAILMMATGVVFMLGELCYSKIKNFLRIGGSGGGSGTNMEEITWRQSLIIGIAQAIAIIPAISRSGSTIVAGIFQGINRSSAAKFSFLLSIPALIGAGILTAVRANSYTLEISNTSLLIGFFSSLIFGLISIHLLITFLKNHSLKAFAVYLIVIGVAVKFFG